MSDANSGPLSPDRPAVDRPFRVDAPFEPPGEVGSIVPDRHG